MSDYVDRIFAGFIAETEGREIDLTGAYGPQSPDLIIAYIQALTGSGWIFEYPYTVDLWDDRNGSMVDFERVADWQFMPGDIGVFKQSNGIGTLGILTGIHAPGRFKVYTQNPGPAGMTSLRAEDLLGAWRLTAGAECKAIATEYAAKYGPDPAEWRPEYDAWVEKFLRPSVAGTPVVTVSTPALPEPHWLKVAATEQRRGDIAVWKYEPNNPYGHVEIVPDRRWRVRLRSFLARLADSVRGRK